MEKGSLEKYICKICSAEIFTRRSFIKHIKLSECMDIKDYYDKYCLKDGESKCSFCGEDTMFRNISHGYSEFCSKLCASRGTVEKRKSIFIDKYGVDNPHKVQSIKEKIKRTCIDRYGANSPLQCEIIKEKIKKGFVEKYGVDNPWKSKSIKKKIKKTLLKNYGVEHPLMSEKIRERMKNTNVKKYGVENYALLDECKDKYSKTCMKRYGVNNMFKLEEIKEKSKRTSLKKYGFEYPFQSKEIQNRMRKTLIEKYGVDNYSKTDEFREFAREQLITSIKDGFLNGEIFSPRIGNLERECINALEKESNYQIERQYESHGFFTDGCIKDKKVFIEFYEKWHNKPKITEKDVYREEYLKAKTGFKLFVIRESDWLYNKENVVQKFKEFLSKE